MKPLLLILYAYIGKLGDLGQAEEEELRRGKELVAHAEQLLVNAGFKAHALVEKGDLRALIVDHATQWNADLIVLGSRGLKGLDRLLIGSVSEAVAMRDVQLKLSGWRSLALSETSSGFL